MNRLSGALWVLAGGLLVCHGAAAQQQEDLIPASRDFVSPERFALELRVGAYTPNLDAFEEFYDDLGPLLELELDVVALRIDEVLYLGGGGAFGYSAYSDGALVGDRRVSENSDLDLIPLSLLAVARLDVLARKLSVPLIFTAKLGYTWISWSTSTGGQEDASGWSHGLRWAGQVALDLDSLDPPAARALDEEWGINHSFVFFELWGFDSQGRSLELDDRTWSAGLGFIF